MNVLQITSVNKCVLILTVHSLALVWRAVLWMPMEIPALVIKYCLLFLLLLLLQILMNVKVPIHVYIVIKYVLIKSVLMVDTSVHVTMAIYSILITIRLA